MQVADCFIQLAQKILSFVSDEKALKSFVESSRVCLLLKAYMAARDALSHNEDGALVMLRIMHLCEQCATSSDSASNVLGTVFVTEFIDD